MTKNPLTMIGLTPAILGLGLTQDELYEYCTRTARALFVCVHPDRHHGTQRPEALHFSEAFDLLKDRQVFHAAITEFRGQRRHGSAHTTHRSTEEDTLRLRFQELQRRNAVLRGATSAAITLHRLSYLLPAEALALMDISLRKNQALICNRNRRLLKLLYGAPFWCCLCL